MTTANSVGPSVGIAEVEALPEPALEPAWDIARLFPNQGRWSESEYLGLSTSRLVEFSCGYVEVLSMPTDLHQAIVAYLYEALLMFVRVGTLGTVRFSALPMRIGNGKYREPDVLFLKRDNDHRRMPEFWDGADLVMEVVSDNDRRRDLDTKRREYAQAGIPEYWIVDPMLGEITVLALAGDRYDPAGVYKVGAQAASVLLPGFVVDVSATFAAK